MATSSEGERRGRWGRRLLLVALTVPVGLAAAEAAFRARDHGAFPHLNVYESDPELGVRLRPGSHTRVAFGGSAVTDVDVHAGGFRGAVEPPPRDGEVVFVGDSQTFGLGVAEGETFASVFGARTGRPVYNAGVPTHGPPEFTAVARRLVAARKVKTVVYVVNMANDPFEAGRPNAGRHAVWDGWAVRKESAPASVASFPGREFLYNRSHAFYALRQLWHRSLVQPVEGLPSEGSLADLVASGQQAAAAQAAAKAEAERRARLYETEALYASERARQAEGRVQALVFSELNKPTGLSSELSAQSNGWANAEGQIYLAADANPGDIVVPGQGEEGRPLSASARYIRDAAALRVKYEAELRQRAAAAAGSDRAREILGALSERDALRAQMKAVLAQPLERVRLASPLVGAVLAAREQVEKAGAEFVLLVLPLDVQVSPDEWKKHPGAPVDMSATQVLLDDLTGAVRERGGRALDATAALRAAEPGAFLPGDLHMTPKGHRAVAEALVEAMSGPLERPAGLYAGLPEGRSRAPSPAVWGGLGEVAVSGSSAAGCVTKKFREWLYVRCAPERPLSPKATGLAVTAGGDGDALAFVADGVSTLVLPLRPGQPAEAVFTWGDRSRKLRVSWPDQVVADMAFEDTTESAPAPGSPAAVERICACHRELTGQSTCAPVAAASDDCVRTHGGDCRALLGCAQGDPLHSPVCAAGQVQSGALMHCHPPAGAPAAAAGRVTALTPPGRALDPAAARAASKALIEAAQATVADCQLKGEETQVGSAIPYSECKVEAPAVEAYEARLGAFDRALEGLRDEQQPALASLRDHAHHYRDWLRTALATRQTRGALFLYQRLAIAQNTAHPDDRTWVDPPRVVTLFFGLTGSNGWDYYRNHDGKGAARKAEWEASGEPLMYLETSAGIRGPYWYRKGERVRFAWGDY